MLWDITVALQGDRIQGKFFPYTIEDHPGWKLASDSPFIPTGMNIFLDERTSKLYLFMGPKDGNTQDESWENICKVCLPDEVQNIGKDLVHALHLLRKYSSLLRMV